LAAKNLKQRVGQPEAIEEHDPESALELLIGDAGNVTKEYGGFMIEVNDYQRFPWADVFKVLLRISHMVWVEYRDDKLVIVSKPEAD